MGAETTTQVPDVERWISHRRPSEVQISPDGRLIAYVVRPVSRSDRHWESSIWVVGFDGGEPRQFSSGLWQDDSPRWSPDGTRLAFLSDRAERGKASVYVIPRDGGEAVRVFDQQGELAMLSWSPDGRWLAVLVTEPETEEEKRRREAREDHRVWDTDYRYQRLWIIDPESRHSRVITPPDRQVRGYAWAPDSGRMVVNTSPTPKIDDIFRATEVALVSLDGETPRTLFQITGLAEDLTWSADGAWLAYRGPGGRVVHAEHVYARRVDGGEAVCLTTEYEGTVEELRPLAGGRALIAVASEGLNSAVYRLEWDGRREPLWRGGTSGTFHGGVVADARGERFAGIWSDARHVPAVVRWETAPSHDISHNTPPQVRTTIDIIPPSALATAHQVEWESDPGVTVQGLLLLPPDYRQEDRLPLIVQVHGGPTSHWSNQFLGSWHDWAQPLATLGFAVLLPNPRGSTGRGTTWTNAIFADVAGGEFRDTMAGVDALVTRGIADPERLGICGWSWGGYMTAWTVTQTDRFKAAVMGAGLCNLISDNSLGDIPSANLSYFERSPYEDPEPYWERSPIRYVRNVRTPLLILHGEEDRRVACSESIQIYQALRSLGVTCELVTYPREGHIFEERNHQRDLLQRILSWFSRYLAR
jgi:dipeptidyl aminopeptidase/acylaminoacyl peptidase